MDFRVKRNFFCLLQQFFLLVLGAAFESVRLDIERIVFSQAFHQVRLVLFVYRLGQL